MGKLPTDHIEWPPELESTGEKDYTQGIGTVREGTTETTNDDPSKIGTGAIKYDGGKPSVFQGLIEYFPRALWGVAEVSTFGANKYAWNGWADVKNGYKRYQDAKFRHALQQAMGFELDEDSKLEHLKHEAWGSLAALELYLREREEDAVH